MMYGFEEGLTWYSQLPAGARFRSYFLPDDAREWTKHNECEYTAPDGHYIPTRGEDFPVIPV